MADSIDHHELRELSPMHDMHVDQLRELAGKVRVQQVPAGKTLFRAGDSVKHHMYVLDGAVKLLEGKEERTTVKPGTELARQPLAHHNPRRYTAHTAATSRILLVDSDLLDLMLTWDQTGAFEVNELSGEADQGSEAGGDWMTRILRTRAFHRIPPANIQAMFMRMEPHAASAGDVIVRQGDPGDYFYIIARGKCTVSRTNPANKQEIKLATLRDGDSFGEEALVAETTRNATVTMATDGELMRLSKEDFQTLLNEPLLNEVSQQEAEEMVAKGARWLDVRLPAEFRNGHFDGAINLPLYLLRLKADELDPDVPYIACCDTGRRSSAAAFLLNERGFDVSLLKGGIKDK